MKFKSKPKIEGITSTWKERKRSGGEYSKRHASGRRHVVVCSSNLMSETMMDFLMEFYAHPKLEEHIVVILSSEEKDDSLQMILKDPKWAHRVIYMRGSALKDIDLHRCRLNEADACFILAPSKCTNKDEEDQHTVLRSWAVKDFASNCRQYIQLFKTEYKIHVKFAEHVVCEDEFKFGVCLVAVLDVTREEPKLLLNPGADHILNGTDYCFYIAEYKEEYSKISQAVAEQKPNLNHKSTAKNIAAYCKSTRGKERCDIKIRLYNSSQCIF
ncbi:hypothetical protein KUTeg_000578 [Tegillarca granosa]|uniref:RCK N-terminal domain-containing protein n=1 Tax=Tegillarca granosa TaxID=220873 RepID=A0ABQ9G1D5_TEGGR|nr:hypothetical protein KUTeg_000578 [Tegillarca granosa]